MQIKVLASGSAGNCYYVTDGISPLLIECGIHVDEIQKGIGYRLGEIEGCLISHEHKDHSKYAASLMRRGVDCYMGHEAAKNLKLDKHYNCHEIGQSVYTLGSWKLWPFPAVHDTECYGFILLSRESGEKLLYLTDSAYCPYKFRRLTHIMVGCDYDMDILNANISGNDQLQSRKARILGAHASLDTIIKILQANDLSQLQELYLIHLSELNADPKMFYERVKEVVPEQTRIYVSRLDN